MKPYELIDHTADIGIKVRGKTLEKLFNNAAVAMFDIMAKPFPLPAKAVVKRFRITVKAQDRTELLIRWLNELLFLSETQKIIFSHLKFKKFSDTGLEAQAQGIARKHFAMQVEIKAVTYHELMIEEKNGFEAQVIFDV